MKTFFEYNPFSGIPVGDFADIIVPRHDLDVVVEMIRSKEPLAIELLGRRGRGKTTHLIYLHQKMSKYPLFELSSSSTFSEIIQNKSQVVFVDGIHHLNIFERVKLLKEKKVVIYTTHWSRALECFLARRKMLSLKFKGIDSETLKEIIQKRLSLASNGSFENGKISSNEIESLIVKFGDNYRGIINHLFDQYQ